jgi:tape measure domain-containing protein
MQLLGDLSLGDANRLGFLSKAYTDVFNKGRLQGQEIKQFAENGVGIVAALAGTLGKTSGEILKMSEAGEISFDMMREALQGLTAEGGRFYGAMAARNSTLLGQWDSMIEGIQKTGRAIGDSMLPAIKDVVAQANAMLGKFNELPDKVGFIGDVIEASFDVAIESIAAKWDVMLRDMINGAANFSGDMAEIMADPMGAGGRMVGDWQGGREKAGNLPAAQAKLDELMGKLQGPAAAAAPAAQAKPRFEGNTPAINNLNAVYAEWDRLGAEADKARDAFLAAAPGPDQIAAMKVSEDAQAALSKMAQVTVKEAHAEVRKETGGRKLTEGVSSLWKALESPIAEAQMAAQGMWDRGKIKADAAMGTLSNIFTGDPAKKEKPIEPRLAGAMQAGSQDAYSTIVQAMIRQADPVVKAVREQTKEQKKSWNLITQTIKEARPRYLAEFGGM